MRKQILSWIIRYGRGMERRSITAFPGGREMSTRWKGTELIGSTISHYKILEKLGEGGMGVVYKAQDTKLDRPVAIKFLPPHLSASEENKGRFIQEARATAALNHPNILNVYDIDEQENRMFFVMEYIEGKTLKSQIL